MIRLNKLIKEIDANRAAVEASKFGKSDSFIKELVAKHGEAKAENFLKRQVSESGKGSDNVWNHRLTRFYSMKKEGAFQQAGGVLPEKLTNPRSPVTVPMKAEPILTGDEDLLYNLTKQLGLDHTVDYLKQQATKPNQPATRKQLWAGRLKLLASMKKKGTLDQMN